ncbi:MAG: tetratricopeptide repeat protein, partial [Nitrospira sp.]|nr:tetratricopeptide repeat protein [Nitrospira sp.]
AEGLYAAAQHAFDEALMLAERVSGPQSALAGTIVGNMAFLADQQGLMAQAQLLYQRALVIQQQQLGLHHPTVGLLVERYAVVLETIGQPVEAGLFAARAASIRARSQSRAAKQSAPPRLETTVGEVSP